MANGRFIGIMPPHRLIEVLLSEHEEDLSRLGGFLSDTSTARRTSEEPAQRRFRHRFPWLLVGLAGAMLAADIVGTFEAQFQVNILFAFFVPGIHRQGTRADVADWHANGERFQNEAAGTTDPPAHTDWRCA
jgi:magnesium transporter